MGLWGPRCGGDAGLGMSSPAPRGNACGAQPDDWVRTCRARPADRRCHVAPGAVPGTAAGALRALGQWAWGDDDQKRLDGSDWWFSAGSTRRTAPRRPLASGTRRPGHRGRCLAERRTPPALGEHVGEAPDRGRATLGPQRPPSPLCRAEPLLAARRPRPRWRSLLLRSQNQRWYRTTLLGRVQGWAPSGAPVGPWRPIRLLQTGAARSSWNAPWWPRVTDPTASCRSISGSRVLAPERASNSGWGSTARRSPSSMDGAGHVVTRNDQGSRRRPLVAPHPWRPTAVRRWALRVDGHRYRPGHRGIPHGRSGSEGRCVHVLV